MSILLDWLLPYSHCSSSLLKFGFTSWNTWILLKRQSCHTGFFFDRSSTNAAFDWNKWKLKHLYGRLKWFAYPGCCAGRFPVRAPGPALFSVEHSFHTGVLAQNNSSIWSERWKRKACGRSTERALTAEEEAEQVCWSFPHGCAY